MSRDKINVFIKFYCAIDFNDKAISNDSNEMRYVCLCALCFIVYECRSFAFEHEVSACDLSEKQMPKCWTHKYG